ncbi:YdcF family protein, partial [Clostridium perfringens]
MKSLIIKFISIFIGIICILYYILVNALSG